MNEMMWLINTFENSIRNENYNQNKILDRWKFKLKIIINLYDLLLFYPKHESIKNC